MLAAGRAGLRARRARAIHPDCDQNGYGKRSSAYEYRRTNRGGQGITNIDTSERNGNVIASFPVKPGEQLMLVTDQAKMIRTTVGDIRVMGRNTQGVTIFRVAEDERVVSVAKIEETDDEIEVEADDERAPEEGAESARTWRREATRTWRPRATSSGTVRSAPAWLGTSPRRNTWPFLIMRWCSSLTAASCCS